MSEEPLSLALQALGRKERSVAEMGVWLRERGLEEGEVEGLIDHLVAAGTLDDSRFARRYAADKRELAGWGGERIRAALLDRGIPFDDIEQALADVDSESELEQAVELLHNRGTSLVDPGDRQRALGMLRRRGFGSDLAYEAIRRAEMRRAA